jgi:hypothetical protein
MRSFSACAAGVKISSESAITRIERIGLAFLQTNQRQARQIQQHLYLYSPPTSNLWPNNASAASNTKSGYERP